MQSVGAKHLWNKVFTVLHVENVYQGLTHTIPICPMTWSGAIEVEYFFPSSPQLLRFVACCSILSWDPIPVRVIGPACQSTEPLSPSFWLIPRNKTLRSEPDEEDG